MTLPKRLQEIESRTTKAPTSEQSVTGYFEQLHADCNWLIELAKKAVELARGLDKADESQRGIMQTYGIYTTPVSDFLKWVERE